MSIYSGISSKVFFITFSTFLTIISPCSFGLENKGTYEDAFKLIDVWLEAQKDYARIPAIMGVIVKDQEILWTGSFGQTDLDSRIQSNENTISSICSISKVFTATATMKLVDEGKISLNDKVKDILPRYTVTQKFPESEPITVRSLLSHTSGLPTNTEHGYWSGPDHAFPTKEDMLGSLATLETIFPVGTGMKYSNVGYSLLGMIIEEVSGVTYKEYIEENIFQPLQMSDSFVEMQASLYGKKHAVGYTAINRNGKRKAANFYQTKAMQPAAGISTSVLDLAKFAMWQFRLADSLETEIMSPLSLKSMYSIQASNKRGNIKRGYGYEVFTDDEGNDWVMHGGMCPGYVSYLKIDVTNKMAYAILVNANRVRALAYVNGLINIIKRAERKMHKKANHNSLRKKNAGAIRNPDLTPYIGFYNVNPWNSEYYVTSWGDGLAVIYLPTESLKNSIQYFSYTGGDTFKLINGDKLGSQLKFFRDDKGRVVKVKNEGNYHYRITN